ncbi:uncharacterized protein L3040_004004 [Drepanopeziza brunnea f. sp. 'multigermtubi']|uniref:uncharacterized protein n=1 Tax=Drepanopeziza brunnea f. sp. 'multigermtubi' TaxID=698441 RepID=UPI0023867347|nr:hypothetical protein L3040_004004 [Drepanopeziza brunnea f. sp. 'multigermtubi']
MSHPTVINVVSFFYPIGNTPAVCLTQDYPLEENADILLLGCGDVRNILFTTYADASPNITCCDVESAIIARNILLFTLLIDDSGQERDSIIWQIYYHLFIDAQAIKTLQSQCAKLLALSENLDTWHAGKYGKLLKFCDQGSLDLVKERWAAYAISDRTKNQQKQYETRFEREIMEVKEKIREASANGQRNTTGMRSAAPATMEAFPGACDAWDHFWEHGSTDRNPSKLAGDRNANPTFARLDRDTFSLHYGTDPHLGFPLATAYVPLTKGSPLAPAATGRTDSDKVTDAARNSFRAWSEKFRERSQHLTLRFCVGDVIALCYSLQHQRAEGNSQIHWYRNKYTVQTLVLDGEGYGSGSAPLCFDVIETSNLVDHLGPLNVLVAASPLLKRQASSTLYTESLVAREKTQENLINGILCGSFPTVSILLGLTPVEYWTNATAVSNTEGAITEKSSKLLKPKHDADNASQGQMYCRMPWKAFFPTNISAGVEKKLQFDAGELACLLHRVYLGMFECEDMAKKMADISVRKIRNDSAPMYHRGSLAAFLKLLKSRVDTDWYAMVDQLTQRIKLDESILTGGSYLQELYVQMHLLDVFRMPNFDPGYDALSAPGRALGGLAQWAKIPPAVCINLVIPRSKVGIFKRIPRNQLGTPLVNGIVQSATSIFSPRAWQNIFVDVHLAFGKVRTAGSKTDEDFRVIVDEDPLGWNGESPLLVSFTVPSWNVLVEPSNTLVKFGIMSTVRSTMTFSKHLGMEMDIFVSRLLDEKNVKITKFPPHLDSYPSVGPLEQVFAKEEPDDSPLKLTLRANVEQSEARISGFTARLEFRASATKPLLADGAEVKSHQISPCSIVVSVGKAGGSHQVVFPVPVLGHLNKVRIARKSSWVEVVVPLADHVHGQGFPEFMYPLGLKDGKPILCNMPCVHLKRLPIIDVSQPKQLTWLDSHITIQLSAREHRLREESMDPKFPAKTDLRTRFKDSLFSIFLNSYGEGGPKVKIFAINHATQGGIHILVFVSRMLLDIANHTIVLDAAILPLTHVILPALAPFLAAISLVPRCNIKADNAELALWKEMLPVWAERCREWLHLPSCEYAAAGRIPLSSDIPGAPVLCSCGCGVFPDHFVTGLAHWELAQKHACRVAISPNFSVPYVEHSLNPFDIVSNRGGERACAACRKAKGPDGADLLKCSQCSLVWYCSAKCQKNDWKGHKKLCVAFKQSEPRSLTGVRE